MKIALGIKEVYRKRRKNWNHPAHAHALTFSCYHNRPFLRKPSVCAMLAESLANVCIRHDVDLWAYVFMPDHVHLLIHPQQMKYSIATFLQAVKQPVSRRVIRFYKENQTPQLAQMCTGQQKQPYRFWQAGGGYDRNIISPDTAWNEIHYIHQNPVRRKYVAQPADWVYSSYTDWNTDQQGPVKIDKNSFYH